MTDDFLDIDALLDAPLKKQQSVLAPPPPSSFSVMDVIGQAKRDAQVRDNDSSHHHRDRHNRSHRSRSPSTRRRSRSPSYRDKNKYEKYEKYDKSDKYEKYEVAKPKDVPLTEAQRDRRTVFVRQLAQRVRSADLKEFCEKAGPVRDAKLVYDKISGRSKGVAYVEFYEESTVQKAIALTGQKLAGIPIIIELTETEKNRIAEEAAEAARLEKVMASRDGNQLGAKPAERYPTKIFVGGLHQSLGDRELRKVFQPFGDILSINIPKDSDGQSKGFAYVEFKVESDAKMAVEQMNGFTLVGKPIRVGIVKDEASKLPTEGYSSSAFSSLDDSETVGLNLNARARAELMQKLSRDPLQMSRPTGPTQTILLTHMYDPEEETELHWEYAISDEVRDECNRYGTVTHLNVTKSKEGEVYVKFSDISGAQTAVNALDGRWFGGKQIKATFVRPEVYHQLFPSSA